MEEHISIKMTKKDLLIEFKNLCEAKDCKIEGIYSDSRKDEIQKAIECLKATDEEMNDYLTVVKLKYPNIYKTVVGNGDYKKHSYNRFYIYSTARQILA